MGEYPDGVFLVELAALADPELVAAEVQAALGVVGDEAGARPAGTAERVARYLATRRALVILDNCEHVLDAASRLAQMVLDRAPGVAVLATSREALGLPGERSWRVPSLSLPAAGSSEPGALGGSDAVTLFCERARVADPSFRLTTANAGAVAGICRRLDGLPLALELAAARLRVLSAEQVAERLDDRFRLLTGGARSALPRHRTLRAAIDWSWDLLSDAERALLRRLTVFPGSFSLAAAETVGADGEAVRSEDVLDLLAALADKSLLGVESGGHEARYSLSQTIREYAAEFLAAAGEADTTRDRHLEHYLDLARRRHSRQLFGGEGWLAFLASDYDNLRAVLEWCRASGRLLTGYRMAGALSGFWAWDGRFEEGRAWLGWALGGGAELPARTRGRLLSALAQVLNQQGDLAGATAAVEEALMLAGVADDDTGRVQALAAASELALQRGDVAESRRLLAAGWAGSESLGQEAVAYYETGFGWVAVAEGDLHTARARFEASLESFRAAEAGDDLATPGVRPSPERGGDVGVYAAGNLAPVLAALGEVDRAHDLVAGALARAHELGRGALVMARVRAAETWIIAGHPDQAREHVLDALSLLREMGGRAWVADALELAAIVIAGDGQAGPAVRVAAASEAIREAVGGSGRFRLVHDALERAVGEGVHSLGPAAAAQERATGRALSATQALTFARDHLASG